MRVIRVSERDLLFALQNRAPGVTHYLDKQTGDVVPVFSYNREMILAEIKKDPNRFLRLAPPSGRQGYAAMVEFAQTVAQPELRAKLEAALNEKSAFHAFRAVIEADRAEEERWLEYRGNTLLLAVCDRLRAADIEVRLVHDRP